MDRKEYFKTLHNDIAFRLESDPDAVALVRVLILGQKRTSPEAATILQESIDSRLEELDRTQVAALKHKDNPPVLNKIHLDSLRLQRNLLIRQQALELLHKMSNDNITDEVLVKSDFDS